ncbi:MAG: 4Fe-4S binding protein [Acetatifactor sp.]|nr:4Fe-4S binding protein [Acetatifactor sp.]
MKIANKLKRKLIQIAAFGFTNSHIGNFMEGKLYIGKWKQFCNPGLNCYSCPAASFACPIGAMQAVAGSMNYSFSFYVTGFLLAIGVLLGRFICGWICPFGLIQEFIHKIPSKKLRLPKPFTYVKYAVLLIFVIILPVAATNYMGIGKPAFCQFICPSGTLVGGIPMLSTHKELRDTIGLLFSVKMTILLGTVIGCVFIYRFFCKTLCPLGAIYGLLNKVSFYHLEVDKLKCVKCGKCVTTCKMDVDPVKNPNSAECIRCGACQAVCPTKAISIGFTSNKISIRKEIEQ